MRSTGRLTAEEVGRRVLANFADRNARAQAAGEALRAEIRSICDSHQGPDRLTAKRVLGRLVKEKPLADWLPSERTVQWHMQKLRSSSVLRGGLDESEQHRVT